MAEKLKLLRRLAAGATKAIYMFCYGVLYICLSAVGAIAMIVVEVAPVFFVIIGILIFALCVAITKAIWQA